MPNFETARFTVTYSKNCDGGLQEFSAAAKCIRDVFPDSMIIPERTNAYPIKVVIAVENLTCDAQEEGNTSGKKSIVWSGKQQNLFENNPNKRAKCVQRIKSKLADLRRQQEGLDLERQPPSVSPSALAVLV